MKTEKLTWNWAILLSEMRARSKKHAGSAKVDPLRWPEELGRLLVRLHWLSVEMYMNQKGKARLSLNHIVYSESSDYRCKIHKSSGSFGLREELERRRVGRSVSLNDYQMNDCSLITISCGKWGINPVNRTISINPSNLSYLNLFLT